MNNQPAYDIRTCNGPVDASGRHWDVQWARGCIWMTLGRATNGPVDASGWHWDAQPMGRWMHMDDIGRCNSGFIRINLGLATNEPVYASGWHWDVQWARACIRMTLGRAVGPCMHQHDIGTCSGPVHASGWHWDVQSGWHWDMQWARACIWMTLGRALGCIWMGVLPHVGQIQRVDV